MSQVFFPYLGPGCKSSSYRSSLLIGWFNVISSKEAASHPHCGSLHHQRVYPLFNGMQLKGLFGRNETLLMLEDLLWRCGSVVARHGMGALAATILEDAPSPTPHSCLGNPMDREAWQATVHGDARESDTTE